MHIHKHRNYNISAVSFILYFLHWNRIDNISIIFYSNYQNITVFKNKLTVLSQYKSITGFSSEGPERNPGASRDHCQVSGAINLSSKIPGRPASTKIVLLSMLVPQYTQSPFPTRKKNYISG